jgi:hypothetical protein
MYAEALTEVASGVVRLRLVTVRGEVETPLRRSSGDNDTADGAGATGLSLVEQLTRNRAANIGRRRRWRIRRVVSVEVSDREAWEGPGGNSPRFR